MNERQQLAAEARKILTQIQDASEVPLNWDQTFSLVERIHVAFPELKEPIAKVRAELADAGFPSGDEFQAGESGLRAGLRLSAILRTVSLKASAGRPEAMPELRALIREVFAEEPKSCQASIVREACERYQKRTGKPVSERRKNTLEKSFRRIVRTPHKPILRAK